ncbi:acyltransferase [Bacteroides stercorirosoris]|uniref:acyltransferase n=1 Tax=Bacteroides stercorirosoris TaxID=871324 RepID=UPI003522316A
MVKIVIIILNIWQDFVNKCRLKNMHLGYMGKGVLFAFPSTISNPSQVYLHDYSNLQRHHTIYNYTGKFVLKEYSVVSVDFLVVTGNHKPTVGIPLYLLALSHINDSEKDVIVEEDVWIGARVTLLAGAHIGRGAVIGANTLVNKEIPPYAVVVGSPAKIIAAKFTINQIMEHERILYPENKRFTKEYLEELFNQYYTGKKTIGISCDLGKTNLEQFKKQFHFEYLL